MQALAQASYAAAGSDGLDVESRLVALARSGAPLRRALTSIAARLVATRAWERLGFARLRDYAVERTGLSARQLQDLAHVDGALGGLPQIDAAFVAGRLTWTKARLLCRVATQEDESLWLEAAGRMTARALAREVRALDSRALEADGVETDEDGAEEAPRDTVWLRITPRVRARWGRAQMLACRVAGETIPQAAVAEVIAAEVMSAFPLDVDPAVTTPLTRVANPCAGQGAGPCRECGPSASRANACATQGRTTLPPFLSPLVEGLESADAFELDARLRRAVRLEQRLLAEMGPLLLEGARSRSYRLYGCPNAAAFAREHLGMSPRKAQALLRLEHACALHPPLREAYRNGRLSWVQAHTLIPVLELESAAAWVTHAEQVTVRRLAEDVERRAIDETQTGAHPTAAEETVTLFFAAPADVARLFRAVLATVQRRIEHRNGRLASQSEALDAMLEHCFETWGLANEKVPREHRVFERDGWRCTVPDCTSYRNLHDHHVRYRSAGGLRGVHAGIVRIRGRAPDELRFELGVRPGHPPLVAYAASEERLPSVRLG